MAQATKDMPLRQGTTMSSAFSNDDAVPDMDPGTVSFSQYDLRLPGDGHFSSSS